MTASAQELCSFKCREEPEQQEHEEPQQEETDQGDT
jgi:hypothetical protein